ncbi:MAG: nucleoside deaminase [Alphaproteobacteria bacterium]
MRQALSAAEAAAAAGEVPVGAVVVDSGGKVIAIAGNRVEADHDPTAHAEIVALREAARKIGSARLIECDLYVTLEPCAMCAGAIAHARIRKLVFGAYDPKGGGVEHGARVFERETCHHKPDIVGGIDQTASERLLKDFFATKRS